MTIYDYVMKNIPEYTRTMFLDDYSPEQILQSNRLTMIQEMEERKAVPEIHITSEVKGE